MEQSASGYYENTLCLDRSYLPRWDELTAKEQAMIEKTFKDEYFRQCRAASCLMYNRRNEIQG